MRDVEDALDRVRAKLAEANAPDSQYVRWLGEAATCLRALGRARLESLVRAGLRDLDGALAALPRDDAHRLDRARLLALRGEHAAAAEEYAAACAPVRAAFAWEDAGAHAQAREAWAGLAGRAAGGGDGFIEALLRLGHGAALAHLGDTDAAAAALAEPARWLEEEAPAAESRGDFSRAHDCWQVLLELHAPLGARADEVRWRREQIRLLREDGATYFVWPALLGLRDVLAARGDAAAAAELDRELAAAPPGQVTKPGERRLRRWILSEWELNADVEQIAAALVCAPDVGDRSSRLSLLLLLDLDDARRGGADVRSVSLLVATRLGDFPCYDVLPILERLYAGGVAEVRAAVMESISRQPFVRTLGTIASGLLDMPAVRGAALPALHKCCSYAHGLAAVRRLHDRTTDPTLRTDTEDAIAARKRADGPEAAAHRAALVELVRRRRARLRAD